MKYNFLFRKRTFYEGENIQLVLLHINGSEQPKVVSGLGKGDVNWFDWSRDGRQIVFLHTTETQDVVFLSK